MLQHPHPEAHSLFTALTPAPGNSTSSFGSLKYPHAHAHPYMQAYVHANTHIHKNKVFKSSKKFFFKTEKRVLGMELVARHIPGRRSLTEMQSQPQSWHCNSHVTPTAFTFRQLPTTHRGSRSPHRSNSSWACPLLNHASCAPPLSHTSSRSIHH